MPERDSHDSFECSLPVSGAYLNVRFLGCIIQHRWQRQLCSAGTIEAIWQRRCWGMSVEPAEAPGVCQRVKADTIPSPGRVGRRSRYRNKPIRARAHFIHRQMGLSVTYTCSLCCARAASGTAQFCLVRPPRNYCCLGHGPAEHALNEFPDDPSDLHACRIPMRGVRKPIECRSRSTGWEA